MGNARKMKYVLAGAALCAATPALASDFSGLIYIFVGLILVVGLFAFAFVFALRSIVQTGSVVVDVISAALMAMAVAPAGFVNDYGETIFVWFPGWVMLILDLEPDGLWPGYPISLVLVGALFVGVLRLMRSGPSDAPAEPEE